MHDEDNFLGLHCANVAGESWKAFGDKRMFEDENKDNCQRMRACLQASADEVYESWKQRKIAATEPANFAAWKHTPTMESLYSHRNHSPLFTKEGHLRDNVEDAWSFGHSKISRRELWASVYARISRSEIVKQY